MIADFSRNVGIRRIFENPHFLNIILFIHGIVILLPFNVIITAKYYFEEHKLAKTTYDANCLAFMGIVMQLPNLFFSWLNIFRAIGGERIVWCLCGEVLIFLFTVLLAMLDSSQWPFNFYMLTLMSIFVISVCNAFFFYYVLAILSILPPVCSDTVEKGSRLCGTLVVIANMFLDIAKSHRTSTIYYFIIVLVVLLVCLDLFLTLPLNGFYRQCIEVSKKEGFQKEARRKTVRKKVEGDDKALSTPSFLTIFKEGWVQNYTLWFICFVSFSVFPAVHSDIQSASGYDASYFTKITCFLTYNVTAFIGSMTAHVWNFPRAAWLWKFALVRALFWPFFLVCNYQPRQQGELVKRTLPVLFQNDAIYWGAAVLLGWSMGHGCTLGMMYVGGGGVAQQQVTMEGKIGAAMVVTGIFCGLCFSLLAPTVVTMSLWKNLHVYVWVGPTFP